MILGIFFLLLLFCEYNSLKKFTIHSEGKDVITSRVYNQGECSSIAITHMGAFIKYKSDSSIISSQVKDELKSTISNSKDFMCQYATNKVILIRNQMMTEITLDGNGNFLSKSEVSNSNLIISLQCNLNLGYYVITYLTDDDKKYNFKIYPSSFSLKKDYSSGINSVILSSSCILIDNSHVLCINTLSTQIFYYYHKLNSASVTVEKSDNINIGYKIKGSLIKYYSNNEILLCINAYNIETLSDIKLICYMLKAIPDNNELELTTSSGFEANEKVTDDISYCQIEKLSSANVYASICLTYYLRTTYLLSVFKYESVYFSLYNSNYKDINFPLLTKTSISISSFENESFGIFFKDIDDDSMILMFYPKCGYEFDLAPKETTSNCYEIGSSSANLNGYYYDECTHSFKEIPTNYTIYERNQFCTIKRIECDNANYVRDNFGKYECWEKNNPPPTYYYVSPSGTDPGSFKKCFRSCLTCSGEGNETDNNCQNCKENFFPIEDLANQCHHKDEPLLKYFFDEQNKIFTKCRKECLTCDELGNINTEDGETDQSQDTKCTKCLINDYWPQVDKPSNCIKKDSTNIQNYYALEAYQSWEKCFDGCRYCTKLGTSIYDTQCDNSKSDFCSEGYATIDEVDTKNCFKINAIYDNYFYNNNIHKFQSCNEACLQCSEYNKCIKCKESSFGM